MKKYKINRVIFEEKVFDKKRKPVYGTRKLSVGLVSCMLGFMMFLPTSKASEEDTISTNQQVEDKNQVLDKTDDFADQEKEEVTPLNDQTDSKVDSQENLSDQNLDGQNKEEDIIKEENSDSKLENKDEELLTADEIQAIRDRANSLENDYFFNDNMVEDLKAELRKAKADPSVNYEKAKARLIDEAIQKNAPAQKAPGEERAVRAVGVPTIKPVSPGATTISGGGLIGSGQRKHFNSGCKIIVKVYNENKEFVEEKSFELAVDGKEKTWSVNLDNPVKTGYTVTAIQEFNGGTSTPTTVEVQKTLADKYEPKIKNENIKVYTEDKWVVSIDEKQEIIDKFKANNSGIVDFDKDVTSIEYKEDKKNNNKTITLSFTDKSSLEVDLTNTLTLTEAKEVSKAPTVKDITVVDDKIEVTLADPFVEGTKIAIRFKVQGEGLDEGQCAPDKRSTTTPYITASGNKFIYQIPDGQKIDFDDFIEIKVKEPDKKSICSIKRVILTHPKLTKVKDPKKLTDQDKENIKGAIRTANTVNGVSKLPDGTGDWSGVPAVIQIDENGNAKIFRGNDAAGDWDPNNDYKFVPEKNEDGSVKVKQGSKPAITFQAKDLVENLGPEAPTIKESDNKKSITVNPITNKADTDIIEHTVTYTGTDGQEKKIVAKQDLENKTWTISEGSKFANIDTKTGLITIDKLKIKNETEVKALVQDNGEYVENSDKKYSPESKLKVTKTKADQVTELGGLDPVEIRKWVGEDIDWSKGIKVKKDENKDSINKLLKGATVTDATETKRNTKKEGDFVGKISVKFDDGSELIVDNQYLYVSNHVTSITRDKTPTDALEVEFKLGEGTKVDNTSGGAIEGNKDNPTSYSKYKVKPGTDLKKYKLPLINSSVIGSINLTPQKGYTEPVWKDKNNGENFIASADNSIFTATATKTYKVTLDPNGGGGNKSEETKKKGDTYKLPDGKTFTPPENEEFVGWQVNGSTTPENPGKTITIDKDTVIKALWKKIQVKVTYNANGGKGKMTEKDQDKGSKYTIKDNGFDAPDATQEFDTWEIDGKRVAPGTEIDLGKDNTVIKAIWKKIQVNVNYDANGGSGTMDGKKVDKGSDYTVLENTFKAPDDTLEFSHWEVDDKKVEANKAIKIDKDTVIKALWKKIQVKVTYDGNGGKGTMAGKTVDKGSNYTVLENTFKAPDDTQEFKAWEVDGKEIAAGTAVKIDKDTVIKALWKKIQVNVNYDANGGSGSMEGKKVDKGSDYTVLPNAFKAPDDNQEFKAWEVDGKEVAAGTKIKLDKDTEIKALWKKIQVKVTYNANGGKGEMIEKDQDKGSDYATLPNKFEAPDDTQEFKGWEVNGEEVAAGTKIKLDKDTEIKALWKKIQVKVTYNANGGSGEMTGSSQDKGTDYTVLPNAFTAPDDTQEFSHWEIDGKKVEEKESIKIDKDTVIKAIWKNKIPETPPVENYTVSFKTETGATGTMPDQTVAKGKYTLPNPTFTAEKGKEFAGWKVGEGTDLKTVGSEIDITGNVTLTAVWKGEVTETVKVSYDANGGSGTMTGAELKKGSTYKLLANSFTAPEGKEFDCWMVGKDKKNPDEEITVEGNVTVVAQWRDKTPETPPVENYTVSFKTETGATGTMPDQTVAKGKYTLPNPTFTAEKGKEFAGWKVGEGTDLKTVGSEIDITGNVTLTAVWKGEVTETVKVSYDANGGSGTMTGAELKKGSTYKLLANSFKAPDKKKFKGWKIGDKEYSVGDLITVNENTIVTAIWEDIKITPPVTEKVQVSYEPGEGTGSMDRVELTKGSKYTLSTNGFKAPANKKFKAWKIGDREYAAGDEITVNDNTIVTAIWEDIEVSPNPDQGGDKPNPGTNPGGGDNPDKPGTRPGEGDNPDKPGENPRPRTKPNGGENISKPKPDEDKITKKPEDNKENSLNNRKVQVTRTKDVKENVQTGVESLGKIGGILSAAIAGLFASKKRKK